MGFRTDQKTWIDIGEPPLFRSPGRHPNFDDLNPRKVGIRHALRTRAGLGPFGTHHPEATGQEAWKMPFATLAVPQAILPVDLTALLAVFMGTSIVLIPIIGLTARFALKPTVEALTKLFEKKGGDEAILILERRMALIEHQLESIESNVTRLAETTEFDRKLGAAPQGRTRLAPSPDE
jgi:hypothetical protein